MDLYDYIHHLNRKAYMIAHLQNSPVRKKMTKETDMSQIPKIPLGNTYDYKKKR